MSKKIIIGISILFLIYGVVRFGVSSALLMQSFGWVNFPDFQDGINEIGMFLVEKNPSSLFSLSAVGYLSYLWVMGALLIIGAIGFLKNKSFGPVSMSAFLVLYVMLFINFQTVNPKVFHLIVCALLFGVVMKAKRSLALSE